MTKCRSRGDGIERGRFGGNGVGGLRSMVHRPVVASRSPMIFCLFFVLK